MPIISDDKGSIMPNLNGTDSNNENQMLSILVRKFDNFKLKISKALKNVNTNNRQLIKKEGGRSSIHVLTQDDAELLESLYENPPPPTPHALKAVANYQKYVMKSD